MCAWCTFVSRTKQAAQFSDLVVCLLPLQIEIVYNNGGYIAATQEDAYYNVFADDEPADTLQTFQKPPGS